MDYLRKYSTPEGFSDLMMESDGEYLTGLWFVEALAEGEVYRYSGRSEQLQHDVSPEMDCDIPVLDDTVRWLDEYFSGERPHFTPRYRIEGATPFRLAVSRKMSMIPYGETITYGRIAELIREDGGTASAIAVGGAVGWNPICIIVPCHRVIGSDGSVTGYSGGLVNKLALLKLEGLISR